MDPQRKPVEAQRKKVATYGKLASRGHRAHASSSSSLPQTLSNEATSSAAPRQKLSRLSPPQSDDFPRPQKAFRGAASIDRDAVRKQREREADTTRKRSHKSAFDVKDSKANPREAGSADSHETTLPMVAQKKSSSIETGVAELQKDTEAKISSTNKRPETPPTRRRRLIDALVAEESNNSSLASSQNVGGFEHVNKIEHRHTQEDRSSLRVETPPRRTGSDSNALEKKKIKVTYSQSRSILQNSQESNTSESNDYPPLLPEIDEPRKRQPSPSLDGGDDDEEVKTKVAIRSVHELRRAGANNRSSDEMDDLLSRIGAPGPLASTMRRNGLCELADKLQKKEFISQFRDHASRDNIAKGICTEKDTISGFLLASVLIIFLSSGPAPHMLQQLTKNRVGLWLSNLLDIQEDITAIAAQKSSNMSRATRGALAGVKSSLLGMRIWHGYTLVHLSPRTIALQLLTMLVDLLDPYDVRIMLDDASTHISKLRTYFATHDSRDDVDYALTICILDAQSGSAAATEDPVAEIQQEMSEIAAFLQSMLQSWPKTHKSIDATLLKLAINMTNNEARATAFQGSRLLSSLVRCTVSGFSAVQNAIHNSAFESNIYDELLLILGIMINILEHCLDARASVNVNEIDQLVVTWSESERSMDKDDSVETSKLGIAYSYLAIILGYLYLGHPELPVTNGLLPAIQHFRPNIPPTPCISSLRHGISMPSLKQRKVAIVGSRSVGKSSLAVQFVDGHFVDSYYPTIENTFSKTIQYKGQDFATEIVDTAGQDEYSILNSKHFIGIHGYMLVYSVSNLPSFEMVQVIREKILNHLGTESVPIVIVGNKSDLRPEQRQVTPEDGKKLSEKFQCGWTEASARYNQNVGRAFELLIAQIEKSQNPGEPPEKSNCRVM
ncbi:gtp-binding rhb1 [Trichoderma arundinaceum]|uniref:Gtp-binding rhb1 n=1 Tax=Trichoderma arundinaceum TaxID=490622 RepID=A0A395NRD8_TRIAR|nr:gtp-binding rhb1 [Trichoderma arundinaceum]